MLAPLSLEVGQDDSGHPILLVAGEIDLSNVESFRHALVTATTTDHRVTVDLRGVQYLDSAAISVMCQNAENIHVIASPLLRSALTVSGLSELTTVDIAPAP